MTEIEFLGARVEKEIIKMVERTAKEEQMDKTRALKELIVRGYKQFIIQKALELYKNGKCSIDKAAKEAELTVAEMMEAAAKEGIRSTETIEEYREGLKLLT